MKKLLSIFICVFALACALPAAAAPKAMLVADMDSGLVLYQENGTAINYPASLTKLMTLYLAFDALDKGRLTKDQNLIISTRAAGQPAVKLGLKPGEKISVETAIKALIIRSANDVAVVLSENLKGDEGDFSETMTRIASEIGLKQTNFQNASGLPNDDQTSSARDIALLAIAIYKHFPQYFDYFAARAFEYNGKTYSTHNDIVKTYPGATGMKTGFTNKAKYNLAASARRDNVNLVAIVLGADNSTERLNYATRLLDYGFAIRAGEKPGNFASFNTKNPVKYEAKEYGPASSAPQPTQPAPKITTGAAGIQFGAFGTRSAAENQANVIRKRFDLSPKIEPFGNLFRVRVYNLSESSAAKVKSAADAAGISSFVFH